jgi:hypothetical protein
MITIFTLQGFRIYRLGFRVQVRFRVKRLRFRV